jgi:hypothetical protein
MGSLGRFKPENSRFVPRLTWRGAALRRDVDRAHASGT